MQERRKRVVEISVVAAAPAALALLQAGRLFWINASELGLGLPIDDAYIFIRYAENMASGHGFSFNPGETSFGCTSLLWPALLAAVFKAFPFLSHETAAFWAGACCFAASASLAGVLVSRRASSLAAGLFCGLLLSLSPIMLMNGVSGMETGLTFLLLALIAWLLLSGKARPVATGIIAGLMTLNRPEAAYFAPGVLVAWLMLAAVRGEKPGLAETVKVVLGWAILAVPAGFWIHSNTGFALPGTYLGKIMSIDPDALDRGALERLVHSVLSLGDGWLRLIGALRLLGVVIAGGAVVEAAAALLRSRRGKGGWPALGRITLFGFLFLPASYGLAFPVGPPFGGYYIRYIAPVMTASAVLGTLGAVTAARLAGRRWKALFRLGPAASAAVFMAGTVYLGWLWSFQMEHELKVFESEVRLNTGIRSEAAKWVRENTEKDARVMVGYTGLGVVGAKSRRYVLDLGALINPDIYSYYQKAGKDPGQKWKAAVSYMNDKGVDYYVTFEVPEKYKGKIADPCDTPGFSPRAVIADKEGPGGFSKIIVFELSGPGSPP